MTIIGHMHAHFPHWKSELFSFHRKTASVINSNLLTNLIYRIFHLSEVKKTFEYAISEIAFYFNVLI